MEVVKSGLLEDYKPSRDAEEIPKVFISGQLKLLLYLHPICFATASWEACAVLSKFNRYKAQLRQISFHLVAYFAGPFQNALLFFFFAKIMLYSRVHHIWKKWKSLPW